MYGRVWEILNGGKTTPHGQVCSLPARFTVSATGRKLFPYAGIED